MSDVINSVNSSLYFSAAASAAQEIAKEASKKKRAEEAGKRLSFMDALKKNREAEEFVAAGFPPELAVMGTEEAVSFLKDRMDDAGDRFASEITPDAFSAYKFAVNQFVKYIVKNNFKVEEKNRTGIPRRRKTDPLVTIQVISEKLDKIATDMLSTHKKNLNALARVNEIQGLVIDLLAA